MGGARDRHGRGRAQASSRTRPARRGWSSAMAATTSSAPRIDADAKIVEMPRPAGVVLALTPVDQPGRHRLLQDAAGADDAQRGHRQPAPAGREAAPPTPRASSPRRPRRAGAPDGVVQVVEEPTIPLIEALMADRAHRRDRRHRRRRRSCRPPIARAIPAIGVGPGQRAGAGRRHRRPRARPAKLIVASKSFDNSILCTNESCVIVEDAVADALPDAS